MPICLSLLLPVLVGAGAGDKSRPTAAVTAQPPAQKDVEEHKQWQLEPDFPFQISALGTRSPIGKTVNKSVTLRLGRNVAMSFDTDLLRVGAAWTGGFIEATGVTFDGTHGTNPRAGGAPHLVTAPVAGWADRNGRFRDPRAQPFGPLPPGWARWDGLELCGDAVVLGYTVHGTKVREQASSVHASERVGFVRALSVAPATRPLALLIADVPGGDGTTTTVKTGGRDAPLTVSVPGEAPPEAASTKESTKGATKDAAKAPAKDKAPARTLTEISVVGAPPGTRLEVVRGRVVLRLATSPSPALFHIVTTRGPADAPSVLAALTTAAAAPSVAKPNLGGRRRWPQAIVTRGVRDTGPGPYVIDRLTTPFPGVYQGAPKKGDWKDNVYRRRMMIAGFDFFPGGTRAALSTWEGDVWIIDGIDEKLERLTWRRFASGLYEPLGLAIVGGVVHVSGRDQITRLHDRNGDGEADVYENFNNQVTSSQGFHEFQFDLQTDARGNFYTAKAAPVRAGGRGFGGGGGNGDMTAFSGTLQRISPDGKRREVIATGLRAPNGIGVGPRGELTASDNEGTWMPACPIHWIRPGSFHGVEDTAHRKPLPKFSPPLCWISKAYDNSGGSQVWVPEDARWGPFGGELLHLSYGRASVYLVMKQKVGDLMQGGIVRLVGGADAAQMTGAPKRLTSSAMRARFNPADGQLYVAGLSGWQTDAVALTGFDRVRYTGKAVHGVRRLSVTTAGIELGFDHALDPTTSAQGFAVERWNYERTSKYGSPEFSIEEPTRRGHDRLEVRGVTLGKDGKSVLLDVSDLRPAHQMLITVRVKTADGTPIRQTIMHTVHRLPADPRARKRSEAVVDRGTPGVLRQAASGHDPEKAGPAGEVTGAVRLAVPRGTSPTPFVAPGPYTVHWRGNLWPELAGRHVLAADVDGDVRISVDGKVVPIMEGAARPPGARRIRTPPLELERRAHALAVELRGDSTADAHLRLGWARLETEDAAARFEPIPATALRHSGTAADSPVARELLGRELFLAHRCGRCHLPAKLGPDAAPEELGASAPSFAGIGSRLTSGFMRDFILDPRAQRPDAHMPALLSGDAGRDEAGAIAAYLASLKDEKLEAVRTEDAAAVKAAKEAAPAGAPESPLIAKLRCGGCHIVQAEAADDGRIPLQHARQKFLPGAITRYLEAPAAHYPWNPMPDFRLTRAEARELEASLRSRGGSSVERPVTNPVVLTRGRTAVESRGCLRCHDAAGVGLVDRSPTRDLTTDAAAKPTARARSCVHGKGPARHPFEAHEVRALDAFVAANAGPALLETLRHVPAEMAERQLRHLRCRGCHTEDGNLPDLNLMGDKLRPEWVEAFIAGKVAYKPRAEKHPDGQPWMEARMPAFVAHAPYLSAGMAAAAGQPATTAPEPPVDPTLAAAGAALVSNTGGFSCLVCHGAGPHPATQVFEVEGINLAHAADRLRPAFFRRWLRDPMRIDPSTKMPTYFDETGTSPLPGILGGRADQQIEAIWHHLRVLLRERAGGR